MVQVMLNGEPVCPASVAKFRTLSKPALILVQPSLRADRLTNILQGAPQALEKNIEQVVRRLSNNHERDKVYKPALARVLAYALADFEEQTEQAPTDLAVLASPASVLVSNDLYAGLYKFVLFLDAGAQDENFVITRRIQLGKVFYTPDGIVIADKRKTVLLKCTSDMLIEVQNDLITVDDLETVLCKSQV